MIRHGEGGVVSGVMGRVEQEMASMVLYRYFHML